MNTDINPIIEAILRAVAVDEIYHWTFDHDSKKYQMLQINIASNTGMRHSDPRSLINKIVKNRPSDLYIKVCLTHEAQKQLDLGQARTYLIYQPENRVYQNPVQEIPLIFPNYTAMEIIEKNTNIYR